MRLVTTHTIKQTIIVIIKDINATTANAHNEKSKRIGMDNKNRMMPMNQNIVEIRNFHSYFHDMFIYPSTNIVLYFMKKILGVTYIISYQNG